MREELESLRQSLLEEGRTIITGLTAYKNTFEADSPIRIAFESLIKKMEIDRNPITNSFKVLSSIISEQNKFPEEYIFVNMLEHIKAYFIRKISCLTATPLDEDGKFSLVHLLGIFGNLANLNMVRFSEPSTAELNAVLDALENNLLNDVLALKKAAQLSFFDVKALYENNRNYLFEVFKEGPEKDRLETVFQKALTLTNSGPRLFDASRPAGDSPPHLRPPTTPSFSQRRASAQF